MPANQVVTIPPDEVIRIISGTSFLVLGLVALAAAGIRRRSAGVLAVVWLGIWSASYGLQGLNGAAAVVSSLPRWLQAAAPYLHTTLTYFMVVMGASAWRELTQGKVRRILNAIIAIGTLLALGGIGIFLRTGEEYALAIYNQLLATMALLILLAVIIVPSLSRKYLILQDRGVLAIGSLVFALEAFYANVARPLGQQVSSTWGDLSFGIFLLSLGYVAMQRVDTNERRLQSIEAELAIARQLQFSILPTATPEISNLRIAAAYEPMTAVAGDFYEYLPVGDQRAGFLIADVSGHGVPAALIASMIKMAVQSVAAYAHDPSELMRRLRDVLSVQLQGQFVSAAYLWIDTESHTARYSAAGHPPLFFWRAADCSLVCIESNGLLLGVPIDSVFPTRELSFVSGDRFLLYTDGFSEPENAAAEAFGDDRVQQILRENSSKPAAELSLLLLSELRAWQPASTPQQDDITFLVIDVI